MSTFEFEFTEDQVQELLHGNKEYIEWFEAMEEILPYYDINTVDRVAGFIAQCAHESNNFRVTKENLNYSAKGLNAVFPKYFVRAGRNWSKVTGLWRKDCKCSVCKPHGQWRRS